MREINATYTEKHNLLRQQEQIYFITKCKNPKVKSNVLELLLNVGVKRRELANLSVLHSVHDTGRIFTLFKQRFFLSGVYREFRAKIMEIKGVLLWRFFNM